MTEEELNTSKSITNQDKSENMSENWTKEVFDSTNKVSPADFVNFMPWAAEQLRLDCEILVTKSYAGEYNSSHHVQMKKASKQKSVPSGMTEVDVKESAESSEKIQGTVVKINAVYTEEALTQVKFTNNRQVPRKVLQIVGLIANLHVMLTSITINQGMDEYTVHELSYILQKSNISELVFDGAFCREGNFDLLLEHPSKLKHLSLARCKIEDATVAKIAERLVHSAPGGKNLNLLNLSSNRITNVGARALSQALRTNRSLFYLNLANNFIDDDGALSILKVLQPFLLTVDEILDVKRSKLSYQKKLNKITQKYVVFLTKEDFSTDRMRRKSKPATKKTKLDPDISLRTTMMGSMIGEDESVVYVEATKHAKKEFGEFDHPLSPVTNIGGLSYCNGNFTLSYINFAYNNLSVCTLQHVVNLLGVHRLNRQIRKSGGIINLVLEGNPIPNYCNELKQIDYYLGLQVGSAVAFSGPNLRRRMSSMKKTPTNKQT